MRSIRLSMLVYFLGLLTVALGVASLLVYRSAQQTLRDKEEATAKLIEAKFEQRRHEEQKRLDDALLDQASVLAERLKINVDWPRRFQPRDRARHFLGVLTAVLAPCGYVSVPTWAVQFYYNENRADRRLPPTPIPPFAFEVWRSVVAEMTLQEFNENQLQVPTERRLGYFQVDANHYGKPLRSASLGNRFFPDPHGFGDDKLVHWEADDFELPPGKFFPSPLAANVVGSRSENLLTTITVLGCAVGLPAASQMGGDPAKRVRRVRVKASSPRLQSNMWRGGPRPSPPGGQRHEPPPIFVVLQVASDLDQFEAKLSEMEEERDAELAALKDETIDTLQHLRNRLLGISSLTFLATVLGSCWLVWMGLLPLRRVGEAVSKVSPRDFRLQLDHTRLPGELRPIVERLTDTLALLQRAFAREKQATADISHELRTPLAAMLTNLELALRKNRPAEQYRGFLEECRGSAMHMHQIVERLLTLARLDAGVDRLRPQPVDVSDLAEQCATVVRPLAEAHGLRLECHTPAVPPVDVEGPTRMSTDPDKLREVLNNLLHNAVQYNRPNGRIDLHVSRDNGRIRLEVCDTGIGIPAEARERIFERFYRADPARSGDGLNAGLGLSIVKEYVDLMGGQISVESQEGQGSTFRIDLPVRHDRPSRRPAEAAL